MTSIRPLHQALVAGALLAAAALFTFSVAAQPGRGPRGAFAERPMAGFLGHMADRLDLSDEQRDEIRGIFESYKDQLEASRTSLGDARDELFELTRAETVDEAAIHAAATLLGTAEGDAAIVHARLRQAIHAVLTPEQLALAQDMGPGRRGRRGRHHGHRGFSGGPNGGSQN